MIRFLFIGCLLFSAPAHTAELPRIGLFSIQTGGISDQLSTSAIDILATALSDLMIADVVTTHELNAMIQAEKIQDAVGCDDITCLAEIGAAAGVEKLISGSIAKSAGSLIISLQLINIEYGHTENRVTLVWPGKLSQFANVLGCAMESLVLKTEQRPPGLLYIATSPRNAKWTTNGVNKATPSFQNGELPIGIHQIEVRATGHNPVKDHVIIRANKRNLIDITLVPKITPLVGWGFQLGNVFPLNGSYGLDVTGATADLIYWGRKERWVFVPRLGFRVDLAFDPDRNYAEWVGDIGIHFLLWDDSIAPFIGVGAGGRQLMIRGPKTLTLGQVIQTVHTTIIREEKFWWGAYARIGAEFFRNQPVHVIATIDYNVGYHSETEQTRSIQSTLGFVY